MSENTTPVITDTTTANAVVTMVKNQIKNEKGKYSAYVKANNVTPETVAAHVKALREQAFPGVKSSGKAEQGTPERMAKQFADKVRIGLQTVVGKDDSNKVTDWIKLVRQAAENAHNKGDFSEATIVAAVREALTGETADES